MDKYFTIMLIPEKEKGVKSIRIPHLVLKTVAFIFALTLILLSVLAYDYWQILSEVRQNNHLTIENRQLREQIQLFQMKVNSISEDLSRIYTFEKKLRVITGIEEQPEQMYDLDSLPEADEPEETNSSNVPVKNSSSKLFLNSPPELQDFKRFKKNEQYQDLKSLYEQKILAYFGLNASQIFWDKWNELTQNSLSLASSFAEFDYKFLNIKKVIKTLEVNINKIDQFILDRESFLRSTPTLLPTRGWVTSYYGPRISPTAKVLRMHEGIDIGAVSGTPIVASADGRVIFSGSKPGFGNIVHIDHGYGIESFYAHAKKVIAKIGSTVKRGEPVAAIGNTGSSTGPHLHYEIRVNGTPVDPLYYILDI